MITRRSLLARALGVVAGASLAAISRWMPAISKPRVDEEPPDIVDVIYQLTPEDSPLCMMADGSACMTHSWVNDPLTKRAT